MLGVLADNVNPAVTANDLAILADWFGTGSYFHKLKFNRNDRLDGENGLQPVGDPAFGQIIGADLQFDPVAGQELDLIHPHLAG